MTVKQLQNLIQKRINNDSLTDELIKLSYDFKKALLIANGWVFDSKSKDGFNNDLYLNEKHPLTQCFLSNNRAFCFKFYDQSLGYWFQSEIIFESIINNI